MGLPRYMASARVDDLDRTVWLANALASSRTETHGSTVLLQVGRPSPLARDLGERLDKLGRHPLALVVRDRPQAQSDMTLAKLAGASAVWVFTEDLFEAFLSIFATPLAFALRLKARDGLPVVGIGRGALTLGGLVLANRICRDAQYDLVGGLGWAPRVLLDGGVGRAEEDGIIARTAVRTLPGLLGIDLGLSGGVSVKGGRVESIGNEPIQLLGASDTGALLMLSLEPGKVTTIAPPPFAPFERGMLPPSTFRALTRDPRADRRLAEAPPLRRLPALAEGEANAAESHAPPGSGKRCPMCRQIHALERTLELAA